MSKKVPNISEAEWEVMNVLWDRAPQTANEVIHSLQERTEWKPKTVRTLLDRLVQKKWCVNQNQKVYTFFPCTRKKNVSTPRHNLFLSEFMVAL